MWMLYILIGILLVILLLYLFTVGILHMIFGKRCEGNPKLKYYTAEDFEDLDAEKIEFKSNEGQILRGFLYKNKNVKEKDIKGLLVFVHGMGAGHFAYTTEINTLTKNGYKVIAYDNTGTCLSEGKKLNGFYQAVLDLKACLEFIKNNDNLKEMSIGLIGHSWGAYTVCQVLKYKPNVKAVVALSGPNSFELLVTGPMGKFGEIISLLIKIINKKKFSEKGIEKVSNVLKNIDDDISVLLIHGEADKTCTYENSIVYQKDEFKNKENIMTILYEEKYHNVYQTLESEKYLNLVFDKIKEYSKTYKGDVLKITLDKLYQVIDYDKMTEEDEEVLETIIEFFDNTL